MSRRIHQRWLVLLAFIPTALFVLAYLIGIRINLSSSVAIGAWITRSGPIAPGAYVLVCPPNLPLLVEARERGYLGRGNCPGGFQPLMKRLAAVGGDSVRITRAGITINGMLLPHSKSVARDDVGRTLGGWDGPSQFQLGEDEIWLYGDGGPASFDARYFGPVSRRLLISRIDPVWVF